MMEYTWGSVDELAQKLRDVLSDRHPGEVTDLQVSIEGDTIVLSGEVASEGCRGDAKRHVLSFDGVFKVANRLEVAAFLEGASDSTDEDEYFGRDSGGGDPRPPVEVGRPRQAGGVMRHSEKRNPVWNEILRKSLGGDRREGFGLEYASVDEDEQPDPVEVSRYPTVEKFGTIAAGETIQITVGLSPEGDAGESPISVGSFAVDWTEIEVSVQIAGAWLSSIDPTSGSVILRRNGSTSPAAFECRVSPDYVSGSPAELLVYYLHGTRVCGHLRRDLSEADRTSDDGLDTGQDGSRANVVAAKPLNLVTVVPDAVGPTLAVTIAQLPGDKQHWTWTCFVPNGRIAGSELIELGVTATAFAHTLLVACPDLPDATFRRTMVGIGEAIWRKAPSGFRDVYIECRARMGRDFPVQFCTDDPHVPWEMMKPDIENGTVDHLFIEHPVARWQLNAKPMPAQFESGEIVSFVPDYSTRKLPSATAEGSWICSTLGAVRMEPTKEVFFHLLDGKRTEQVMLIHFAGHGRADSGSNDGGIEMQNGPVGLMDVYQASVLIGDRDRPLVVLNACEASAGAEMLGMNTGWGAAIIARGFGGLIAPLWAVKDAMALKMAQDTLPPLVAGRSTLGKAVRDARRKNASTSVAALAYLTHGDVMARFVTS